jgi:hypothetical protein
VIVTGADGYAVPRSVSKKTGMEAVVRRLECKLELVAAMGDTDPDVDMLRSAEVSYAPIDCSLAVGRLARSSSNVRLIKAHSQQALLNAVVDLIERRHGQKVDRHGMAGVARSSHLIDRVLDMADEPELRRCLRIAQARLGSGRLP